LGILPTEAWLVGKGPSLLTHQYGDGPYICINDAYKAVPNPYAVVAIDRHTLAQLHTLDAIIIRRNRHPFRFKKELTWSCVRYPHRSAPIAIELCYSWGVRCLHLVGFDSLFSGDTTYAQGYTGTPSNLAATNQMIRHLLSIYPIEVKEAT